MKVVTLQCKDTLPLRQAKVLAITAMMLLKNDDRDCAVSPVGSSGTISSSSSEDEESSSMSTRALAKKCRRTSIPRRIKASKSVKVPKRKQVRKANAASPMPVICLATPPASSGIPKKLPRKSSRHNNRDTFPVKLWKVLESGTCPDTIHWTSDGKAFIIRDKNSLAHVLPHAGFAHSGLRSFHRQLSYWCFTRYCKDSEKEVWSHPQFYRGMSREELTLVIRVSHKGNPMRRKGMTLKESAAHVAAICSSNSSVTIAGNDKAEITSMDVGSSSLPTATTLVLPLEHNNLNFLVSPKQECTSIENYKEQQQHSHPMTVKSILQPRRIDFEDEELMSPEETSLLLSVTIPVGEDHMNESMAVDDEEYDSDSYLPIGEIMQEFKESNVNDLSVCSWVPNCIEMDEDVLQTLPFNDTGAVSLSDEEDCMSLADLCFLETEESITISV